MYYKEFLRVSRGLIVVAIIFGILIALQVVSNVSQHSTPAQIHVEVNGHQSAGHNIPLSLLLVIGGVVASILAGIWGTSLACENEGHLEVAWTKPATRSRYALKIMAVDLAGLIAVYLLTLGAGTLVIYLSGYLGWLHADNDAWVNLARFSLLPFAWFGLIQALTSSLKDRAAMVAGLSWVGAFLLLLLANLNLSPMWAAIVKFFNFFNPVAYAVYSDSGSRMNVYPFAAWELNLLGLAVIGTLGIIAALIQWRRLEV